MKRHRNTTIRVKAGCVLQRLNCGPISQAAAIPCPTRYVLRLLFRQPGGKAIELANAGIVNVCR